MINLYNIHLIISIMAIILIVSFGFFKNQNNKSWLFMISPIIFLLLLIYWLFLLTNIWISGIVFLIFVISTVIKSK
jgi:hypothetical protein